MSVIEFNFYESKYVLGESYKEKVEFLGEGSIKPDSLVGFFRINILRLENSKCPERKTEIINLLLAKTKDETFDLCIRNKVVKVQDASTAVSIIRDIYFPHTAYTVNLIEKTEERVYGILR